jgi:S-formylglutathione hydrolase FrmB
MALIECNFYSETLGLCVTTLVILPQKTNAQLKAQKPAGGRKPLKTLWLLHGNSDDQTIWLRRSAIERYVAPLEIAVVMPAVNRSFYADMASGPGYWTFISEELPLVMRDFFPLSGAREDNFVAGLSMGGYGAFKLALAHPERFAAAASLSGALGPMEKLVTKLGKKEFRSIFGNLRRIQGSGHDLYFLAKKAVKSGQPLPRLYAWCGDADFLYKDNLYFVKFARKIGLELFFEADKGADHQWAYWDKRIQSVLKRFFGKCGF